ncbi:MAG TPA: hypothetical protein VKF80_02120 [Candidatus Eisenbacteria bacterium]|nr:hypothetical protein [Candidatus Eisenbacteria bacterium]
MSSASVTPEELQGRLTYFDQPAQTATVRVIRYDRHQRLVRALLALAACWGLAAVTILIPVLHLILVPAFFLLGPFLAYQRLREEATVLTIRGACPACGQAVDHGGREAWKPLLRLDCPHCRRRIVLETELRRPA